MNDLQGFISRIRIKSDKIQFNEVIKIIDTFYIYKSVNFKNGLKSECLINKAGENEGSCKIFSFAHEHKLTVMQTLHCFGDYYRNDVLLYPDKSDHQNIRNFMKHGWNGIHFDKPALRLKQP